MNHLPHTLQCRFLGFFFIGMIAIPPVRGCAYLATW